VFLHNNDCMMTLKPITAENLEPWNGNIVDLTMLDGTHRTGLLQRVDSEWVRLKTPGAPKQTGDDGLVRISLAASVSRAARN
jgi:hypothetical protein